MFKRDNKNVKKMLELINRVFLIYKSNSVQKTTKLLWLLYLTNTEVTLLQYSDKMKQKQLQTIVKEFRWEF